MLINQAMVLDAMSKAAADPKTDDVTAVLIARAAGALEQTGTPFSRSLTKSEREIIEFFVSVVSSETIQ